MLTVLEIWRESRLDHAIILCGHVFDAFDTDGSGYLSEAEGKRYLIAMEPKMDLNELNYFWSVLLTKVHGSPRPKVKQARGISKAEFVEYVLSDQPLDDNGEFLNQAETDRLSALIAHLPWWQQKLRVRGRVAEGWVTLRMGDGQSLMTAVTGMAWVKLPIGTDVCGDQHCSALLGPATPVQCLLRSGMQAADWCIAIQPAASPAAVDAIAAGAKPPLKLSIELPEVAVQVRFRPFLGREPASRAIPMDAS